MAKKVENSYKKFYPFYYSYSTHNDFGLNEVDIHEVLYKRSIIGALRLGNISQNII